MKRLDTVFHERVSSRSKAGRACSVGWILLHFLEIATIALYDYNIQNLDFNRASFILLFSPRGILTSIVIHIVSVRSYELHLPPSLLQAYNSPSMAVVQAIQKQRFCSQLIAEPSKSKRNVSSLNRVLFPVKSSCFKCNMSTIMTSKKTFARFFGMFSGLIQHAFVITQKHLTTENLTSATTSRSYQAKTNVLISPAKVFDCMMKRYCSIICCCVK